MLNQGTYYGHLERSIIEAKEKTKSAFMALYFNVTHVLENNEWVPINECTLCIRWYLTEAAWQHSLPKMKKLGFDGDFDNPKWDQKVYEGIQLYCKLDEYEGKPKEVWDVSFEAPAPKKAENDILSKLKAKWKLENPPAPAKAPQPAPTPEPQAAPANPTQDPLC